MEKNYVTKIKICVLLILVATFAFGQEGKVIDSLKREIKKNPNSFEIYNSLAWEFILINKDQSIKYNEMSKKLIKNNQQKGQYLVLTGKYCMLNIDFENSLKFTNQAIEIAKKHNDYNTLASAFNTLTNIENYNGNIEKALELAKTNLNYALKSNDEIKILNSYINLNSMYISLNNFEEAKKCYDKASKFFSSYNKKQQAVILKNYGMMMLNYQDYKNSIYYLKKSELINLELKIAKPLSSIYNMLAENYINLKDYKTAMIYSKKGLTKSLNVIDSTNTYYSMASINYKLKSLKEAKICILKSINFDEGLKNKLKIGEDYCLLGRINSELKDYKNAEINLRKSIENLKIINDSTKIIEAYRAIIENHFLTHNNLDYKSYFDDYQNLSYSYYGKEKVYSVNELDKKYQSAEKEAKIKTQQLEIEKEKTNKYLAFGGIGLVLLVFGGGFWFYRNRQQKAKLKNDNDLLLLQQNMNFMQLDLLNKQLNTHEYKNILSNISPEIQRGAPDSYNKMTKLLNITKASLINNQKTDSIDNELNLITDYLDLEKQTLETPFDYSIANKIENKDTKIPRLMLKNLVENSIKHGIRNKKEGGRIDVVLSETNDFINISVDDTGVGRLGAIATDSGIGTSTYINLFEILNKKNKQKATFEIIDKTEGTTVLINIPTNYQYS